nr:RES family NAD+ phosphorylase [Erythrobacter ani]
MLPDASKVGEGRINPRGIACLYLATKMETAALESRPLIGSYVSIAHFRTERELRIVDCSEKLVGNLERIFKRTWTPEEIEKQVWTDINNAFSAPVERSDDVLTYVPTQIIAEAFKAQGFDGVAYKSGYGEDGFNVAVFDVAAAKLTSCGLYRIAKMRAELDQADNPYEVREDGIYRAKITAVRPLSANEETKPTD